MNKNKSKTQLLVEYLQGTSIFLEEGLNDLKISEEEIDLVELEDCIKYCESCGWWFEATEIEEDEEGTPICEDCMEEVF